MVNNDIYETLTLAIANGLSKNCSNRGVPIVINFQGGIDFAKGLTQPEPTGTDRSLTGEAGAALHRFSGNSYNSAGQIGKMLGFENLGNDLQNNFAKPINQGFDSKHMVLDGYKTFLDPKWWASAIGENAPTSLSFVPFGLVGKAAGGALAGATKMGPFGSAVMEGLGMGAATAPLEAAMEAGQTYESMYTEGVQKGMSPDQARKNALEGSNKTFVQNLALLGVTNSVEFAHAFTPKGAKKTLSRMGLDTPAAKTLGGSAMEGGVKF